MKLLLAGMALLASGIDAATLRGTVVEAQSGRALARTLVAVHPLAGSAGATQSVRTNSNGMFEFPSMPGGSYIVLAAHKGFAPFQYGQKQWKSAGTPVVVQDREETVLRIALPRFGGIIGRISDEADVGLVEHEVIAYRNTRPPVMVAKAPTDDRGVYRIFGLEPGSYVVRAAAKQYEEGGGYLPTFYKETPLVDNAYAVEVKLDRDTMDVNIRPTPGRLYVVSGQVAPALSLNMLLMSDMGSETVTTDQFGRFRFSAVAPGKYELLAQAPHGAGWQPIEIDRDRTDLRLPIYPIPTVEFVFEDGKGGTVDGTALQLMARRKDLSGPGTMQYLQLAGARAQLQPGRWQFALAPNPSYYGRGWSDAVVGFNLQGTAVRFVVSPNPGAVHGVVTTASGEAAAGAPVYLEKEGEVRNTRTDVHGGYSFGGLAPGEYRILATFEARTDGSGQVVQAAEGQNLALDLRIDDPSK